MKGLWKMCGAFILVVAILLSAIPIIPLIDGQAASEYIITNANDTRGSDYTNSPALAAKLDEIFSGTIGLYSDSSVRNGVSVPLGSRKMTGDKQYYIWSNDAGSTYSGWQCCIYGTAVYGHLFDDVPSNSWIQSGILSDTVVVVSKKQVTSGNDLYNTINNAKVKTGAYIRTTPNADGSYTGSAGHSMIVLSYDANGIFTLEGNGDGNGLVAIYRRTWDQLRNQYMSGDKRICYIAQPTDSFYNSRYPSLTSPNFTVNYAGRNGEFSEFSWSVAQNAAGYNLRIFDTAINQEVEFSQWNLVGTSCSVRLPQGNYKAYVDAYNDFGVVNSNTVYFTVQEGQYVPYRTIYHNGHIYSLYTEMHTWQEAKGICEKIGGHLVTITSEEEDDVVNQVCRGNRGEYWLGLTDEKTENTWEWITGESFSYDHWQPSQPDNWDGLEHYASCVQDMAWNDLPATARRGFICEFDVSDWEPTATTYYGDSKYEFYSYSVPWTVAKLFAENSGGHLPYIHSAEENEAIYLLCSDNTERDCWLGANDYGRNVNDFVWNDGSTLTYENWNENEPNDTAAREHFMNMVIVDGSWNDHKQLGGHTGDDTGLEFVVEYDNIDMSITLDKSASKMEIGGNLQLVAQKTPADLPVEWSSSNNDVATVSEDGLVVANAVGSAIITVRYGDVSASCEITVLENSALTGIEITHLPNKVSYCIGESIDTTGMVITASYESGVTSKIPTGFDLDYDFSKTGINTVIVTYQGKTASFTVTVNNDWITELPDGANPEDYETMIQYSQREKSFTASNNPSLEGWTLYDSSTSYGNWCEWTDTYIQHTANVQIETRTVEATPGKTQYMFHGYKKTASNNWHFCPVVGGGGVNSWTYITSGWLDYMIPTTGKTWTHGDCGSSACYCPNTNVTGVRLNTYHDGSSYYYWYTTQWVEPTYKTQYRSRPIEITYYYYQWSDWSEWQEEIIAETDTNEVRTQMLYRLKLDDTVDYALTPAIKGAASKLYEPWGLKYFASYDGDDVDRIAERGVVMLKDKFYTDGMTPEEFRANENAYDFSSARDELGFEAPSAKYPNGRYTALLDEGIYSYDISAAYYALPYAVMENGQIVYGAIRNISMEQVLNSNLSSSAVSAEEKTICTCILALKDSVATYYSATGIQGASVDIHAPRGSSQIAASKVMTAAEAGITPAVKGAASRLIEPWGLKFTAAYTADSRIADRGIVMLREDSYSDTYASNQEAMRLNAEAYVFTEGDETLQYVASSDRYSALLTEGISSRDISAAYYAAPFVVLNDGTYVYGTVRSISMLNILNTNLSSSAVSAEEKAVCQDIIDLYEAVKAFYEA